MSENKTAAATKPILAACIFAMPDSRADFESQYGAKCILVLPTTHHTLLAEEVLQSIDVRYLSVPKPQKAVSDCGMAIQIEAVDLAGAADALRKKKMSVDFFLKNAYDEIEPIEPEGIPQGE